MLKGIGSGFLVSAFHPHLESFIGFTGASYSFVPLIPFGLLALAVLLGLAGSRPIARKSSSLIVALSGLPLLLLGAGFLAGGHAFIDAFRGVVLVAIGGPTVLAGLHSITYAEQWDGGPKGAVAATALPIFIASMAWVVVAGDFISFLVAWEMMTLASAVLVGIDHAEPANREGLAWYLSIGHISPVAFTMAVALLAPSGFSWESIGSAAAHAGPAIKDAAFLLTFLGAAAKAGLVPLHAWLPKAHPAAPSHVSALMSGSMVNMGAYAFVAVGIAAIGFGPSWWGWTVLAVGVLTALTGALHALVEGDLKRLLAYSTIENMGLLFIALAVALLAGVAGLKEVGVLAMAAALVHVVAHALAKSTLFLGAGSVIHLAGTRLLNRMGGALKGAPGLCAAFSLAAASIVALPPFAGFLNEWLLIKTLVRAAALQKGSPGMALAFALGLVALVGGLAVAAYVKLVGVALLGAPRKVEEAHRSAPGGPEFAAIAVGGFAVLLFPLWVRLFGMASVLPSGLPGAIFSSIDEVAGRCLALCGIFCFSILFLVLVTKGAAFRVRKAEPWMCGLRFANPRTQYTADSFSQPLTRIFAALLKPSAEVAVEVHPEIAHAVRRRSYERQTTPLVDRALYQPLMMAVDFVSASVKRLQSGHISSYAAWLMAAIVVLMAYARWGR